MILDKIKKKSITLLQGRFDKDALDSLKGSKLKNVFVLEGRPSMESAKKTCKELIKRKITPTVIADNMAGVLFYKGLVKEVVISGVVADKENVLCSIGALILAVLGKTHKIPVKVYLCDQESLLFGKNEEILSINEKRVAVKGVKGYVPLMEMVPRKYISKII